MAFPQHNPPKNKNNLAKDSVELCAHPPSIKALEYALQIPPGNMVQCKCFYCEFNQLMMTKRKKEDQEKMYLRKSERELGEEV